MRKFNFLSKSSSQSCGHNVVTLASAVGSPSVHRRSTMLKLLSVLVLIFTFGIGQAWGETQRFVFSSYSSSKATDDQSNQWSTSGTINSSELPADTTLTTASKRGVGMQAVNTTITSPTEFSNVTSVRVDYSYNKSSSAAFQVFVGDTQIGTDCSFNSTQKHAKTNFTSATPLSGNIRIKVKTRTEGTIWIGAVTVVTGGSPEPSLSSIAVKTAPTKTTYTEGEYFAPAGLVITKTMSNSSTEDVDYDTHSGDFSFSPTTSTALTTSDASVTITYGGKSVDQAITVNSAGGGGGSGNTYTLGWGSATGATGTYSNFTTTNGEVSNILSFSSAKNNSQNSPAYNGNSNDFRLYYSSNGNGGSITITPATGITITGAVMTTTTNPSVKYTVDGGTATSVSCSNNTYTISDISAEQSLKIQNVNTSNTQLRITTIAITYEVAEPEPATVVLKSSSCGGATFTVSESAGRDNYIVYTTNSSAEPDAVGNNWSSKLYGNGDITISGLNKNTTYYYWVASSESGDYLYSTKANFTTVNGFDIELTTSDGNGNTTEATATSCITAGTSVTLTAHPTSGYKVSEWTVLDGNSAAISQTSSTATTFTFNMPSSNVMAEATYCALPTAPTGLGYTLNADETRGKTVLSWTAVAGATGYELSYSKDNVAQTPIDVNTNSHTFNPLAVGVYTWSVKAINGCGESAATNGTGFTICPDFSSVTPTVGAASSVLQTTATANWTAVAGAAKYTVQVYKGDDKVKEFENETGTSKAINGLTANTTYVVKVTAYNACNEASLVGSSVAFTTQKNVYAVSFNANGGTGEIAAVNITDGETTTLPSTGVSRAGYSLSGWKVNNEGDLLAKGASYTVNAAVTMYAQWSANTITVTYKANGPTAEDASEQFTYGNSYNTKAANTFSYSGYQFKHWNNAADGSGAVTLAAGAAYTGTEDIDLYAIWDQLYTVTWVVNGTTKSTQTAIAGAALTEPYAPQTSDCDNSKVFVGWTVTQHYTDATDAPTDLFDYANTQTMPVGGATYYAVFADVEEGSEWQDKELEITISNFSEITTNYSTTFTHTYSVAASSGTKDVNVEAYGVYNNSNGIQMNSGKGTYIKNTNALPGYIKQIKMTWTATGKNSPTLYANANAVASTSSTNLGKQANDITEQTINITNPATANYKYFYFDGTTVTGACYMSLLKITYAVEVDATVRTNYATDCNTVLPVCEEPTFNVEEGEYTVVKNVTIETATEGATIYYTTDGSNPATSDTKLTYSSAVRVDHSLTLKAVAVKENYVNSTVKSATYTINLPQCATPTISLASGYYSGVQSVTLSCETANASIYYTTDGNDPTTGSTLYTGAIDVDADMTLKAVAIAENTTLSAIASADYIIVTAGSTVWELVSNVNDLKDGDIIVIASNAEGKTMSSTITSSICSPIATTFSANKSIIESLGAGSGQFTLSKSGDNWKMYNASGYLSSTSNKQMSYVAQAANATAWTISISSNDATINAGGSIGKIMHNTNQPRFTTYTSDASATMLLPQIYRKSVVCEDPENELAFASSVPAAINNTQTAQLATTGGNGEDVVYTVISANAANATISNDNKFSATAAGTYTVQAKQEISSDFKCAQVVTKDITVTVLVSSVELNKNALTLEVGQFETLIATVLPADAANKNVTWSVTEGSAYVEVDANGKVTGKAVGNGVVQVKTEDGEFTATCAVTVKAPTPVLTLTATNPLAFGNVEPNLTKDLTVNLKGSNLVADVSYEISGDNVFTLETALDNDAIGSEDGQTLTIRFAPTAEGNKSATITFSSGVASQTLTVTGTGKKRYTATLHAGNGSVTSETIQEATIGSGITLPEATLSQKLQDGGWSFAGWSETELINETAEVPTTIDAGEYAIAADIDLYAVYTRSNTVEKTASKNSGFSAYSNVTIEEGKPIKFTASSGSGESNHVRIYANATLTVNGHGTTIKKVVFVSLSSYKATNFTVGGVNLTGEEWNGSASSVVFNATKQVRFSSIAVTYQTSEDLYTTYPAELYTIEFDLDGGEGNFSEQTVTKGSSYTLDGSEPTKPNHDFLGWNDGSTTYQAAETIENIQDDIALTAQWDEWAKATTITFKDGETTVDTKENIYKGASYTTPAAPNVDGKLFQGWSDGVNTYAAETEVTMPDDLTEDITITYNALWQDILPTPTAPEITAADLANGEWVLVTAQNQLKEGDVVIIAQAENTESIYAMGDQHVDNAKCWRNQVSVAKSGNKITPTDEVAKLFVQVGYNSKYALYVINGTTGYLFDPQIGTNNYLNTGADLTSAASWNITIDANYIAEIINDASSKKLRYNSTNKDRFSCYSTDANVSLYKWVKKITTNSNVSDVTLTDAVIVEDGATLTINDNKTLDNLTVEAGGQVSGGSTLTVNNLTINSEAGKSGQVMNAGNITASAVYMDVRFYSKNDATALGSDEADVWYSISAPFDVNLNGGFFQADGTPMAFGTDFDLFEYDGEKRATTGVTGWKRAQGKMKAGVACLIGFNESQPTTIRLKAANTTLTDPSTIDLQSYDSEDAANANWNGVANPTLHYTTLDKDAQYFDNNSRGWETCTSSANSFVVGSAFFVHSDVDITLSNTINGTLRAPKHYEDENLYEFGVRITSTTDQYSTNNMYVRASEEAQASYQAGHDLQTLNGETAACALIYAKNYGMRLAIEEAPIVNGEASYEIGMYAPANGEYRIEANDTYDNADLYLTQNGTIIWNLSMSEYTVDLNKGTTNGYGLLLRAKAPSVVTGVDQIDAKAGVQKVIIDEHVYILRGGQMYDVNGKLVK